MKKALIIITVLTAINISCSKDNGGGSGSGGGGTPLDCNAVTNKAFAADVNPIVQSTCNSSGCHASGSVNGPGPLTNYNQVFNARSAVRTAIASGNMPRNTTLSASQKNSFLCWIDSGAPNN